MTPNLKHNLKSVLTQLALLILCVYGVLQINMQSKVIKIKENLVKIAELGIKNNDNKFLTSTQDKILLNFNSVDLKLKETSSFLDINNKKINNKLEFNTSKIESLEFALAKLNLLEKKPVNYNTNIADIITQQDSAITNYNQILNDKRKLNPNLNPLLGLTVAEIVARINKMTMSELVGQLFIIGVDGTSLSDEEKNGLIDFKPAGVILMGNNIIDQNQVKNLTSQLNATNRSTPLLITTDQEGGEVKRVPWDNVPGQNTWANETKEKLCEYGNLRADTLSQIGINLNFAPVVDLGNTQPSFINNRSVSTNPEIVASKIQEYNQCFNKKTFSTLKHFPGHGAVTGDSHNSIYSNPNITKEEWKQSHAIPFVKNLDSPFIMTAHIVLDKMDTKPASMSSVWIKDILKKELGFKGLVITDDMQQYYNISKSDINISSQDAINAGNDLLLYVPNYKTVAPIKENLINYYSNKRGLIEGIVQKILFIKTRLL